MAVDIIGEAGWHTLADTTDNDWATGLETNLSQVFYCFRESVAVLVERGTGGAMSSIASVDGIGSSQLHAAYGAVKAGVISLVRTLSAELGPAGVRVNAVAPGDVGGRSPNLAADLSPFELGGNPFNPLAPSRAWTWRTRCCSCPRTSRSASPATASWWTGAGNRSPWGLTEDIPSLCGGLPESRWRTTGRRHRNLPRQGQIAVGDRRPDEVRARTWST
ncbi:hypothetical protein GCM10009836_24940 [Pseudonocardia ailaonensis]|uniref:Uncharacterized protein n=1 Tax=Pseudonocardia ailaonensis TaxID=367279 RepID=A0ABN2N1L0_9PSEU